MAQVMHAGGVTYTHLVAPVNNPTTPTRRRKFHSPVPRANRVGVPGSRRYQRWLNRSFLIDQEIELELEDFNILEATTSQFTQLFRERNSGRTWEPFVEVTEEKQDQLLQSLGIQMRNEQAHHRWNFKEDSIVPAVLLWDRIDKPIKRAMYKQYDSDFLVNIDSDIRQYIGSEDVATKMMTFEDPFHRFLCHGVCQFYGLKAKSHDTASGDRVLMVEKCGRRVRPSELLMPFLRSVIVPQHHAEL